MKSKTTAGIFALFLGGIGVHRFYLGQVGLGVLYLLFCWTFIPAVVALIDGIIFLTMDDQKFNAKFNGGASAISINYTEELDRLHSLMQKGAISEAEFQDRKSRIMQ